MKFPLTKSKSEKQLESEILKLKDKILIGRGTLRDGEKLSTLRNSLAAIKKIKNGTKIGIKR